MHQFKKCIHDTFKFKKTITDLTWEIDGNQEVEFVIAMLFLKDEPIFVLTANWWSSSAFKSTLKRQNDFEKLVVCFQTKQFNSKSLNPTLNENKRNHH